MRLYIMLTALGLTASAALGYWSGKDRAEASFVSTCLDSRFAVVYDQDTDAHRHFHCFELDELQAMKPQPGEVEEGQLVL